MTRILIDTSVLIKWFHSEGESELAQSRVLRSAHVAGELDAHMLDLGMYEVGNVLSRSLRWSPTDVADQLEDLTALLGSPIAMSAPWLRTAASLAHTHELSFYDASWAAASIELDMPLISADRRLLAARLAESPTQIVARLALANG